MATIADGMRPSPEAFREFLPKFLQDNPDMACAKGGHAAYAQVSRRNSIMLKLLFFLFLILYMINCLGSKIYL